MKFSCCSAFTFNYNQNTKAATSSLNLAVGGITGLTCSNCFAYTGAYLMVVLDYYNVGYYFALEAKVSGALGVSKIFSSQPILLSITLVNNCMLIFISHSLILPPS